MTGRQKPAATFDPGCEPESDVAAGLGALRQRHAMLWLHEHEYMEQKDAKAAKG
jgi:hypothetical protein